ncbi:hypothetical protein F5Y06DRAFT_272991 [Hypoxylon sp. FL0890]|nr:hypothetical protein F5Y06DRAFT_272991 [Hypoxylon sp. FL0890]
MCMYLYHSNPYLTSLFVSYSQTCHTSYRLSIAGAMSKIGCQDCPAISVLQWKPGCSDWQQQWATPSEIGDTGSFSHGLEVLIEPQICLILASAKAIRTCSLCRSSLSEAFCIPQIWWSDYCQNSNGYLGSESTRHEGTITGFNTWAYFEVKQLNASLRYEWVKINIFIRWLVPTNQTIIIAFDTKSPTTECIPEALRNPELNELKDPFWVYSRLAPNVVHFQDNAVWAIRNQVRAIETERKPMGRPRPDYRRLHDIARHAIHVSETLDVTTETMDGIMAQHDEFLMQGIAIESIDRNTSDDIHRRLAFCKNMVSNLRHRAASNRQRLENEIQLAYNTVAQYDADVSVRIGRAAQMDSAAMKTVAFLTMAFLPATFLCSIFSTSFFDYNADANSWTVSSKIWIYWAFAIPTTFGTFTLWYFWRKVFPPSFIE